MKKKLWMGSLILTATVLTASIAQASVTDYESLTNAYKQDDKEYTTEEVKDGSVEGTKMIAHEDVVYVSSKTAQICKAPQEGSECLKTISLGTEVHRVGICENGWSKINFKKENGEKSTGYIQNTSLSENSQIKDVDNEEVKVTEDCLVREYPGMKDGQEIGELLEEDVVLRVGDCNGQWSKVTYEDIDGSTVTGFVANAYLDIESEEESETEEPQEEGTIHESKGDSLFAEAVTGVTASTDGIADVQVGEAIPVSADATLIPMGTFRITHYCQCSLCCGPWANGITSTGVTATTNRTIAVNPSQIPYGSKVVINGQVYVAEDCGGAIVDNCIDIYVAGHQEAQDLGVYYTDVYVIQE